MYLWAHSKQGIFILMELNYKKIGESGPAIVILHGVFGMLDNWLTMAKNIAVHGYTLYLVDQRNHGRSPHSDEHNYTVLADDLKVFIETHQLEAPILIGHSMGGKSVMQFSTNHPDAFSKLVIVDIAPRLSRVNNDDILRGLNAMKLDEIKSRNDAEQFMEAYEPSQGVRQFLLKNLYRKENGGFGWRFNLSALTENMDKVGFAIEPGHQVTAPTLFMRGGNSRYVKENDWDEIIELFPNARLVTIPGAGHWIQAEQPALFEEALMEFLTATI